LPKNCCQAIALKKFLLLLQPVKRGKKMNMLRKITATTYPCILLFLLLVFFISTIVQGADDREMYSDSDIQSAIIADLKSNDAVPSHLIDVSVKDGIVSLGGSVFNILAADRAVQVAESIRGVRSVVSLIQVIPVIRSDDAIRKDIINALSADPATDRFEVQVTVKDAVVILSGNVDSVAEKWISEEVAKGVKGVKAVENNITADVKLDRTDSDIKADVEQLLASDVLLNAEKIKVTVEKGVVTLNGSVGSAIEKTEALARAWVNGVKNVNNELEVRWWDEEGKIIRRQNVHRTDLEIQTALSQAFKYDPRVKKFKVQIFSHNGVVTLRGTVDNLRARMTAETDARNTTGVLAVVNEINVRPASRINDDEIEKRVQEAFARNPYLERHNFSVESYNGLVFLYGATNTRFEKEEAGKVAGTVKGVVDVQNLINVRTEWPYRNDWEIKRDIENQFFWSPFVDGDAIKVSVEDGVATLRGTVADWKEYSVAAENAYEGGARAVKNLLQVSAVTSRQGGK